MLMNDTQIKKNRTDGTAFMILELIRKLDLTSMMSDIFMFTDDPISRELIKRYELQLIGAFEDEKQFKESLHMFFQKNATYIKKNNLFKEFYSFCYFVFSTLNVKNIERKMDKNYRNALNCYYNILFQQMDYFVPHPKEVYGLDTKGKLLMRDEVYPNLDVIMMKSYYQNTKGFSMEKMYKSLQKSGYDIHNESDFNWYQSNDQLLSNMTSVMAYFINENTMNIKPKEYYAVAEGIEIPRKTTNTDIYRTLLKEKRYFLPKKGLIARYQNSKEISEIYFQEVFTDNRIVLLYKVKSTNGKEFCGFYDNKLDLFYSPWEATDSGIHYHDTLENFVLETYCYLTTDIDSHVKSSDIKKRVYLKKEVPILTATPLPSMEFLYEEKPEGTNKKKQGTTLRIFDKRNYREGKTSIDPFVRRLPIGENASEEAIALAKQYHYVLREGETFVRPFERKTYKNK